MITTLKINMIFLLVNLLKLLTVLVPLLIAVAYLTLIERKILGSIQKRRGPNVVGIYGLLQPFADAAKLILKETVLPTRANKFIFVLAPCLTFLLAMIAWAVIPLMDSTVLSDINLGLLYLFAVSSLGVYGIVISGWSSNSRYAFLGGLRSAAQMVSYEVSIGLILVNVLLFVGSLNLTQVVLWQQDNIWLVFPLLPVFILFFISSLAETNRPPFDLPEAEGELVAGYSVEYSAAGFALFFIGEYANIIMMSTLSVVMFLGGWDAPFSITSDSSLLFLMSPALWFSIKLFFILFLFVWIRAAYPRYRYDQLMRLGWKVFLPLSLGIVTFVASVLYGLGGLPL
jgi:NADH-quinone oxidoreductase subunit H